MSSHLKATPIDSSTSFLALESDQGFPFELMFSTLVNAVSRTAVTIWDQEGTILLANPWVVQGYQKEHQNEVMGKNVKDFMPHNWAQERIEIANLAIERNEPITLLEIQSGHRLNARYIPIGFESGNRGNPCTMITIERITRPAYNHLISEDHKEHTIHAQHIGLGHLSILSVRELEILALMGEGLRTKDIAKRMHRSVSTIENHRESIGHKLDIHDRSQLVALANYAVLRVDDAKRANVRFKYEQDDKESIQKLLAIHSSAEPCSSQCHTG